MAPKTNECSPSYAKRIITGSCATVVAVLIIWLCSSTVTGMVRMSVLEQGIKHTQDLLIKLERSDTAIMELLTKIQITQKAIEGKLP